MREVLAAVYCNNYRCADAVRVIFVPAVLLSCCCVVSIRVVQGACCCSSSLLCGDVVPRTEQCILGEGTAMQINGAALQCYRNA